MDTPWGPVAGILSTKMVQRWYWWDWMGRGQSSSPKAKDAWGCRGSMSYTQKPHWQQFARLYLKRDSVKTSKPRDTWFLHMCSNFLPTALPESPYLYNSCYCRVCRVSMSNSLWPHGVQPARLFCPWHFPGKSTGVGCYFFPPGDLPKPRGTLISNTEADSLPPSHLGSL